ncbi:hypothetical protein EYF80_041323 [Liparis tanakae]|uniref:Uncharacterized protein n=1 Tax=Liparis tanakae TaxID=230148 RepID=A0A4Z2G7E9_9TELE|nr:hypothetical protein EYF80_041323 [Liparis tanakae]
MLQQIVSLHPPPSAASKMPFSVREAPAAPDPYAPAPSPFSFGPCGTEEMACTQPVVKPRKTQGRPQVLRCMANFLCLRPCLQLRAVHDNTRTYSWSVSNMATMVKVT